jgi:hypothetical protein
MRDEKFKSKCYCQAKGYGKLVCSCRTRYDKYKGSDHNLKGDKTCRTNRRKLRWRAHGRYKQKLINIMLSA